MHFSLCISGKPEQELSSIGWQEREIIRAKFPTMEKADVIGWFDNDTPVSQVAVYPMHVRDLWADLCDGGLTGSRTHPNIPTWADAQASGTGTQEYERAWTGISVIFTLIPYRIIDAKAGKSFLIRFAKSRIISSEESSGSGMSAVDTEGEELKETYKRYAMRTHGAILRDDLAWNEYWFVGF